MTFRKWLLKQRHRHDAVGDLARDVWRCGHECRVFPATAPEVADHMWTHGASYNALTTMDRALKEFNEIGVSHA